MAYQVSLDQILNLIFARLEILENLTEELKLRNSILLRILSKKFEVTREDIHEAVEEELRVMEEVELIDESEIPEMVESLVNDIYKWLKGDVKELKEKVKKYREKLKDMEKSQKERKIDIAPPDLLHRLDQMKKQV